MAATAQLNDEQLRKVKQLPPAIGPGLIFAIVAGYVSSQPFYESMWAGTLWMEAVAIGAAMFVLLQHALGAKSAVVARRPMEWMARGTAYPFVHFGFLLAAHKLTIAWWPEVTTDDWRSHWFRAWPFGIRLVLLVFMIAGIAGFYGSASRQQDDKPDPARMARLRSGAWPALVLMFAFVCVAALDWILGLDPAHAELRLVPLAALVMAATGVAGALGGLAVFDALVQRAGIIKDVQTPDELRRVARWMMIAVVVAAIAIAAFAVVAGKPWSMHFTEGSWLYVTIASAVLAVAGVAIAARAQVSTFAIAGGLVLLSTFLVFYQLIVPLYSESVVPGWTALGGLTVAPAIVWLPLTTSAVKGSWYPLNG